jgi:hypothetical protein
MGRGTTFPDQGQKRDRMSVRHSHPFEIPFLRSPDYPVRGTARRKPHPSSMPDRRAAPATAAMTRDDMRLAPSSGVGQISGVRGLTFRGRCPAWIRGPRRRAGRRGPLQNPPVSTTGGGPTPLRPLTGGMRHGRDGEVCE